MKRLWAKWARVDGGQFDSVEPASIPQNGWARLCNWITVGNRLVRRGGSVPFSLGTAALPSLSGLIPVTSLYNAPSGAADWCLVAASRIGTFAILKANQLWAGVVSALPAGAIADDAMPWVMKQRNGIVYALRRNAGKMKRIDGGSWSDAGRPAPTTKPTAGTPLGTGGSLADGTYRLAYTYYDSVTGQEGNGSPEETITLSGGGSAQRFTLGSFTAPASTVKCSHFRVYMSQLGGSVLYWLQDVALATSSISVTAAPTSIETLPTRNAEPYNDATWFELWKDRGWLTNGTWVRYTDFNKPECYSAIQDVTFAPYEGDVVTTIYGWGDALVIAKKRSMVLLSGIDRSSFEQRIWTEMVGCVAPHSMKDCEGTLIWLSEDGIYEAAGPTAAPKNISNLTVKAALATMKLSARDTAVAEVIPSLGVYVLSFEKADGSRGGLAYNWTSRSWSELTFPQGVTFFSSAFDSTGATRTLSCVQANASVYAIFEGADDDGAAVTACAISRALTDEAGGFVGIEGVRLLMSATRYPVTLSVYNDGVLTPVTSRTAVPIGDQGWSEFALNSRRYTAAEVQVAISYSGKDQVWISDMAVDVFSHVARRRVL